MATSLLPQQDFTNRRITCRNPQWTYLKLELITHPILLQNERKENLDPLTARTYLSSALSQFLGVLGTAIALDILKIETTSSMSSSRQFLWIRVPREDAAGVVAALSSWVGQTATTTTTEESVAWRVCAKGNFLGAVVHGSGGDVFDG